MVLMWVKRSSCAQGMAGMCVWKVVGMNWGKGNCGRRVGKRGVGERGLLHVGGKDEKRVGRGGGEERCFCMDGWSGGMDQ